MPYIGTQPKDVRSFGKVQFDFTATQGQTAFTGADDDGKTLGFTEGQIQVYVNGILMDASDYTTSNTNTVTLVSAANLNDIITVVALQTDIPNSDYVPSSGGTFTGDVTADGGVTLNPTGGVTVSRGSSHSNNYEGGRVTLKNGINYTKQYGLDTYFENFRIFRENSDGTSGVVRFEIDSEGRVTTPYQPAFRAAGANGTTDHSNSGSGQIIVYGKSLYNQGGHYSTSTGRFTVPIDGLYGFSFNYYTDANQHTMADLRVNGSGSVGRTETRLNMGDNSIVASGFIMVPLYTNDYVEVVKTELGATNHQLIGGAGTDYNYFNGYLIG